MLRRGGEWGTGMIWWWLLMWKKRRWTGMIVISHDVVWGCMYSRQQNCSDVWEFLIMH